jgi:predicted PhzF superfamily epimerase YddE/YHI9
MLARAFVNADGAHGNPALVIVEPEGATPTSQQRQDLADDLAIPATVFVQDAAEGRVRIHGNYGSPIRFGGHPSLAAVDCLHRLGFPVTAITPEAGPVSCRRDPDSTVWLTAPAAWSKPWRHCQLDSPAEIDALTELPAGEDFTQVWAWIDEPAGRIRARLWAPRVGKGEDEACGSASMLLTLKLGRPLEVLHGRHNARILTRPVDEELVELGGRCVLDTPSAEVQAKVEAFYDRART